MHRALEFRKIHFLFTSIILRISLIACRSFGAWQDAVRKDPRCTDEVISLIEIVYAAINEKTGEEFMDNEGSALYLLQRACE
jgi:hypothetical protein